MIDVFSLSPQWWKRFWENRGLQTHSETPDGSLEPQRFCTGAQNEACKSKSSSLWGMGVWDNGHLMSCSLLSSFLTCFVSVVQIGGEIAAICVVFVHLFIKKMPLSSELKFPLSQSEWLRDHSCCCCRGGKSCMDLCTRHSNQLLFLP